MIEKKLTKPILFYFFLYLTLILGFFLNENTTGGAEYDFNIIVNAVTDFSKDIKNTLDNYSKYEISHFPYYYIFLSLILKSTGSVGLTKFIVLNLNLFLPFVFYKIIKIKFKLKKDYLIYLPGIFFLSPSFRSCAIWGLNDNLALIFFSGAIFFYFKFESEKIIKKKIFYMILNVTAIAIASYIRQYYAVFSIYFFYKLLKQFNLKIIITYVFANIILASYAIVSVLSNKNLNHSYNFFSDNFFNNIVFIVTIFTFYLIPFIIEKNFILENFKFFKKNLTTFFFLILFAIVIIYFFDYKLSYGGGVVYKLTYNLNSNLFFIWFILSILILYSFFSLSNFFLVICLFLAFPTYAIYQKYLDPMSLILIFTLLEGIFIKKFFSKLKFNIKILYLYLLLIYIGSIFQYHVFLR